MLGLLIHIKLGKGLKMISLLFLLLAAICNSIMDNLKDHWYISKFNSLPIQFWNPEISWKLSFVRYTKYHLDAWHLFKSLMIIFIILSITLNMFYGNILIILLSTYIKSKFLSILIVIGIYGISWNLIFNLFYNHLLIKKDDKTK